MSGLPTRKAALAALSLCLCAPAAHADTVNLPASAPLPQPRPSVDDAALTAAIPFAPLDIEKDKPTPLEQGLNALSAGDVARANQMHDRLSPGSLDRRIMAWALAVSGDEEVPTLHIVKTARTLSDWPGTERLRANSERALYREDRPAPQVIAAFGDTPPITFEGAVVLARAHLALGDTAAARSVLSSFWRVEKLNTQEETAFLEEFGALLPAADHRHRLERMLYDKRVGSAQRVAKLADAEALAAAWAAVVRNRVEAGKLLEAVPEAQRSAGYIFAKARYLRRAGKFHEAAEVMLSAPRDPAVLIDTDEWWFEQRVLSRELLDVGDAEMAYRIAAAHTGQSAVSVADAEFHAGWYALRSLEDAEKAVRHFARIPGVAEGPISLARAYYWLGRAAEAGAEGDATGYYKRAAAHGMTFYGQLAAAKLGRSTIEVSQPEATAEDRKAFSAREPVRAIRRLEAVGHERLAGILYRDLASELSSTGELALLTAMAEERGNHYLALRMGKIAAARGLDIGALTHPLGAIPEKAAISGPGTALAYAVARQESEFNVGAVSGVGARGLLQLMPATARAMAQKSGLAFSTTRLTSDASYNATLGAAYLDEQLGRFGGSYILTFIGYNAGPRRAEDWMERYGDPRGASMETVVDWIERIPFTETRNYVQRVMENYQVYKMRLTGRIDIVDDLVNGR